MKSRGFDAHAFAQNHPGGVLGKRFHLKVRDLMHQGDQVPVVDATSTMETVIIYATQKKLGAVLVVEKQKLLGLITDGDLRRALSHRERFFDMTAEEVMTRNPVTADPGMLANSALRLMEDRSSQIAVLPVVEANGHWVGLLRLHDLVRSL
jgi:arabinose-5-phosphate isomerase